jgi:nicotinamidase-related amidase
MARVAPRDGRRTGAGRIAPERCWGAVIDVQDFFLAQLGSRSLRTRIETNLSNFARLLAYFRIPMIATLERPIHRKGRLPERLEMLGEVAQVFEKEFFDLTKERKIADHLSGLKRTQALVTGCETDVCVLQSCLGLIDLDYQVFVVEDLLFSSSRDVDAAIARMKAAGAVFLTYKTLFYELVEAVEGGRHTDRMTATYGPFPDDLPDAARR